ncbi:hypothetical protein FSU_1336 [Fibrobacter succinogenes subsp. succinogenes S85]|uniref:Uncharacterized protein n=1 Tax=Fibrobacter succinogenes (strain ATCC 19169 / S85) TaxID=59374 RepID=D9SA07_FIBSS|nr:hypothetical protein FSU_1336 [Fibrobacter succinogenes subsp. succinogenes S85]
MLLFQVALARFGDGHHFAKQELIFFGNLDGHFAAINRDFRHLPHAGRERHDAARKANHFANHGLALTGKRGDLHGFAEVRVFVNLFVDIATDKRRGLVGKRHDRGKARDLFAIAHVHITDNPVFLGNLSEFLLLFAEFGKFLADVCSFGLAARLLEFVATTEEGNLFVGAPGCNCKFVLEALDAHSHGIVAIGLGLGVREALELGRNSLVAFVFRFKVANFSQKCEATRFKVSLDFGHLLVDFGRAQVAAAFESVKFTGEFGNAEREVRTVDNHDSVARLDFLARNHVNLDDFGRRRKADNRFAGFGNATEHGRLALVNEAEHHGKHDACHPGNRKLVGIDVSDTRIVLVGIPEIVEKIFELIHFSNLLTFPS